MAVVSGFLHVYTAMRLRTTSQRMFAPCVPAGRLMEVGNLHRYCCGKIQPKVISELRLGTCS